MMWLREAVVLEELPQGEYRVFFLEHAACKNCGACRGLAGNKDKTAVVPSEVEIKKGDICYVGMEQEKLLKIAFFIYLTPILIFFLLLFGTKKLSAFLKTGGCSWQVAFFVGLAGLVISFVFAFKYFDRKFRSGEWGMRIVKKIKGESER